MRDIGRLPKFYIKFMQIHMEHFPSLREGQLWCNFLGWIQSEKKQDPLYLESEELMELFEEFAKVNKK